MLHHENDVDTSVFVFQLVHIITVFRLGGGLGAGAAGAGSPPARALLAAEPRAARARRAAARRAARARRARRPARQVTDHYDNIIIFIP